MSVSLRTTAPAAPSVQCIWSNALERSLAPVLADDLELLERLPTLTELTAFPDAQPELPGIGVPVGIRLTTAGPSALVVPNAVTDVNDGYRLTLLDLAVAEVEAHGSEIVDALFGLRRLRQPLSTAEAKAVLENGLEAVSADADEQARVWDGGRVGVDDVHAVGADAFATLRRTFGCFGRYGHFLELLAVDRLYANDCALDPEQVLMVIHGGAMEVSDIVFWNAYFDFAERAAPLGLVSDEQFMNGVFGLPVGDAVAQRFLEAAAAVGNAAFAWRAAVERRAVALIGRLLRRGVGGRLLSDLPHNRLGLHDGRVVHAKAVQPLHVGGQRAELAIICGGLGAPSYLVAPREGLRSVEICHGAASAASSGARQLARPVPAAPPTNAALPSRADLLEAAARLEEAVLSLERFGLVRRVARLRPLVNFSGEAKPRLRYDLTGRDIARDLVVADVHASDWEGGR